MVDPELERRAEQRMRLGLGRPPVDPGEGHRPDPDRRNLRPAGPEPALLACARSRCTRRGAATAAPAGQATCALACNASAGSRRSRGSTEARVGSTKDNHPSIAPCGDDEEDPPAMLTVRYFNAAGAFSEATLDGSLFHPVFAEFLRATRPLRGFA